MLCVNQLAPLLADAILPSLIMVWPITLVLLLPIIVVEAIYSRSRLGLSGGQAFRVFGTANLISTVIGFPIAMAVAAAIQNRMQVHLFGTPQANFEQLNRGDVSHLGLAMGQYPRWILLGAAVLMFAMCFAISWWIEAAYVQWWIRRRNLEGAAITPTTSHVVRNANLLSYAMLGIISFCVLAWV
jgi:hypothetical protein